MPRLFSAARRTASSAVRRRTCFPPAAACCTAAGTSTRPPAAASRPCAKTDDDGARPATHKATTTGRRTNVRIDTELHCDEANRFNKTTKNAKNESYPARPRRADHRIGVTPVGRSPCDGCSRPVRPHSKRYTRDVPAATAEDILDLFRRVGALLEGHFRLTSGLHSPGYLQCALVLQHPQHAEALGRALAERTRDWPATVVLSPALGGVVIGHEVARALGVRAIFAERQDGVMMLRRGFVIGD